MNPAVWNAVYVAGAVFAGMLIPIQTAFNAQLGRALQGPVYSTLVVFAAGFLSMAVFALATRAPRPAAAAAAKAPLAAWFVGGAIGATYIILLTILAPRLGAAPSVAFVVVGQLLCSTAIDHFGLIGFPQHTTSPARLVGLALIAAGVALVRLF